MEWTQYLPIICWAAVLALAQAVEGATMGLVSIWFAIGGVAALIASLLTDRIWIQVIVFLVVSLLALLVIRPLARRSSEQDRVPTNADRIIGTEAVVVETIDNLKSQGQVQVGGSIWTARTQAEAPILQGERVRILRIEGVKVIVAPAVPSAAGTRA